MTTVPGSTTTARNFQLQVLGGIAAGEVRRVQIGNAVHMQWHKPEGHVTRFGVVYTRRPTHTVKMLIEAGLARTAPDGTVLCTRKGNGVLTKANG